MEISETNYSGNKLENRNIKFPTPLAREEAQECRGLVQHRSTVLVYQRAQKVCIGSRSGRLKGSYEVYAVWVDIE